MAGVEQRGGQPQSQQPSQPEQTQPAQGRSEGRASLQGPTTVDGSAHEGSDRTSVQRPESHERQSLPNVWDILERKAKRYDNLSRMTKEERDREGTEVDGLKKEIDEKGTDRDKHILALLYNRRPRLSLLSEQQQIQQWRSQVEPLSDHDIAECARKQKEEIEAFRRGEIPSLSFHPSAGDGELILAEHISKKGKSG